MPLSMVNVGDRVVGRVVGAGTMPLVDPREPPGTMLDLTVNLVRGRLLGVHTGVLAMVDGAIGVVTRWAITVVFIAANFVLF